MEDKRGKGQPKKFETKDVFYSKFVEYEEQCELKEKLMNVAGFCVFCMMTRETFYKQKDYYSDTFDIINSALEDGALNNKTVAPAILSLYLKNKCNYREKLETENTNNNTNTVIKLSDEERRKRIEELKAKL